MLNKIIQFSLQNRLFILIASVLLMIGGLYQAYHTEVDVFPDLNAPTVVVMTEAGGMAAEEVEQVVTCPHRDSRQRCHQRTPRTLLVHHGLLCRMGGIRLGHGHIPGPSNRIGKAGHSGGKPARQCG